MHYINDKEYKCSVDITLDIFNDRWKMKIIWYLLEGNKRFKELHSAIPDVSQKTLTVKLKELEKKNIIHREVFPEVPPKVVYSLTPIGKQLESVLKEMYEWGINYVQEHGTTSEDHPQCTSVIREK
ncbi:MAG: helix-turn-helix domain-containing protein [Helicobacteraceae bacterium]|nr:helix-turn-helix domain-containing protein [Helicobacteraceae bacterium]